MEEAGFPVANYQNHLVGFCADGASVNFGKTGGVQQKLRENIPWLIPIWCLPHRYKKIIKLTYQFKLGQRVVYKDNLVVNQ